MTSPRILIYHRVADDPIDAQLLCVSPERFDQQLAILARNYRVVPLARQISEWRAGTLPRGTVSLTFDDGYLDNLSAALPLLEKHRLHATVFVSTGLLGNIAGFWGDVVERILLVTPDLPTELNLGQVRLATGDATQVVAAHDELRSLLRGMPAVDIWNVVGRLGAWAGAAGDGHPPRPVLSGDELRRLAASPFIEIGAHTVSHTRLSVLDRGAQRAEIAASRETLEHLLGQPVRLFAYPYGAASDFDDDSRELVAELGFDAGIANIQGDLHAGSDLFALPRRLVRDWDKDTFAAWMKNPDASDAERASLSSRQGRLLAVRQRAEHSVRQPATERSCRHIVHINTYIGHGGAANSTLRLCRMQRAAGLDARVLAQEIRLNPTQAGDFLETFDPAPDQALADYCRREGLLDIELQGSHRLATHPRIVAADLIHLQNLHGGYFNPLSVSVLSGTRPTVWTLRDMHSLTGHCAHSLSCEGWRDGCRACPDIGCYPPVQKDNCHLLWKLKQLAYRHSCLQIVAPSRWIKDKAEQGLLGSHPVELIYNGVNLDTFRPLDRTEARRRLGLPEKGLLIGTAADYGLANPYKGGQHFVAVARALKARHPEVTFVSIGGKQERPCFSTDGVLEIPHVAGDDSMALFYSALDFFLYTAIADTCPLVLIEGIACGLPAVAFETGGVPEIARHGQEGLIVPYRDERALFEAASELISRPEHARQALRQAARRRAEEVFSIHDMHRRYLDVYERTMARWRVRPRCRLPIDTLPDFLRTEALSRAIGVLNTQVVSAPFPSTSTPSAVSTPVAAFPCVSNGPESDLVALCELGALRFEAGQADEAISCLDRACQMGLPFARPYNDLGAVLWVLGRQEEAMANFRTGIDLQPDDWNVTANLAAALVESGRRSEALAVLHRYLDRHPDHGEALAELDRLS